MEVKKLNFETLKEYSGINIILFVRPIMSKVYRVYELPSELGEQKKDATEILDAACTLKRNGVWFFTPVDIDTMHTALLTFTETYNIHAATADPEQFGRDDRGNAVPEILN